MAEENGSITFTIKRGTAERLYPYKKLGMTWDDVINMFIDKAERVQA